jgi:hypothetical protein
MNKVGYMKSDGRMNLVPDEGTVASIEDPSWYLPGGLNSQPAGDYPGRILKIRIHPDDGWHVGSDGYIKTSGEVPLDRIEASPKITTRKTMDPKGFPVLDRSVESGGEAIQSAYDAGRVAEGQDLNKVVGMERGGGAASGGAMLDEGALPGKAGEMVLQAFKDSMREASNRAFRTHFFTPQRGWLERTLNHPYLGLYPLSYMWGKVLPEFARFLIKRPFGVRAPLVGLANLERVQQAYLGALADDEEFSKFISENEDTIYFANLLFPGNPLNLTVNAPAWARHIGEDVQKGREVTLNTATREIADSTSYAFGPAYDTTQAAKVASDLTDIGEDIFANLEKVARQYDGMFGQR